MKKKVRRDRDTFSMCLLKHEGIICRNACRWTIILTRRPANRRARSLLTEIWAGEARIGEYEPYWFIGQKMYVSLSRNSRGPTGWKPFENFEISYCLHHTPTWCNLVQRMPRTWSNDYQSNKAGSATPLSPSSFGDVSSSFFSLLTS